MRQLLTFLLLLVTIEFVISADFECKKDGLYPSPTNKHKYIECAGQRAFTRDCPSGTMFNATSLECVFDDGITEKPENVTTIKTTSAAPTPSHAITTNKPTGQPITPTRLLTSTPKPTPNPTTPPKPATTTVPRTTGLPASPSSRPPTTRSPNQDWETMRLRIENDLFHLSQYMKNVIHDANQLISDPKPEPIKLIKIDIDKKISSIEQLEKELAVEVAKSHTADDKWFLEESLDTLALDKKALNELQKKLKN